MLDLETELRTMLRDRCDTVPVSDDLEARIQRRLGAKVRTRRVATATVAFAVIAGAVLTTAVLASRHPETAVRLITTSPKPGERGPVRVQSGRWGVIAEPPMKGAYASVWTGTELVVAFRASNVRFAAYDPRHDAWRRIPDPPIQILAPFTSDSTFAWTGSTLLVWGYENHGTDTFSGHHRLLAYTPATRRWQQLASPPISTLIQANPIWTGRELIVWGGNFNGEFAPAQGLAYDPGTHRWRHLAPAPLSTREDPTIVWTGHEMIVWGGLTATKPDRYEGAAYNPVTGSWRPLPASGLPPIELAAAAWTGHEMIVFGDRASNGSDPDSGAAYNPATNRWRPIAASPLSPRGQMGSTWTGRELIVWGGISFAAGRQTVADGAAYDPKLDQWRVLGPSPLSSRWGPAMTSADGLVFVVGGDGPTAAGGDEPLATGAAAYRP